MPEAGAANAGASERAQPAPGSPGSPGGRPHIPLQTPALVMEYVSGASMHSLLERGQAMPSLTACFLLARDVAKVRHAGGRSAVAHRQALAGRCCAGA